MTLFFNCLDHESEKFVLTAFLLKGPKTLIKVALYIVDHFKERVMKCKAFDEIYMIFAKEPLTVITPQIIATMFKENKKFKLTNSMLAGQREKIRPEIIEQLQESFSYEAI